MVAASLCFEKGLDHGVRDQKPGRGNRQPSACVASAPARIRRAPPLRASALCVRAERGRDLPQVDAFGRAEPASHVFVETVPVREGFRRIARDVPLHRTYVPVPLLAVERVRRRTDAEVLRAVPVRRVVAGAEARKGEIRDFVVFESRFGQRVVDREELRFADLLVYGAEFARAARRPKSRIGSTVKWYAEMCCTFSERAASSERRSVSPPKPGMPKSGRR